MLALRWDESGAASEVYCGILIRQKVLENAGAAFFEVFESFQQKTSKTGNTKQTSGSPDKSPIADESWRKKSKSGGSGSSILKQLIESNDNLYVRLGIPETASCDDIRRSYRKLALQYHPDKASPEDDKSEEPEEFLKIQEAYELLSSKEFRLDYDSALPFDDSTPTELKEGDNFYEKLGPVFERNSKWCTTRPCPGLGDENTSIEDVHKFYEFWYNFESWRSFRIHDEYDLQDAQCREERRWYEKQNQKSRKQYQKTEYSRIFSLVEFSYSVDPRIKTEKLRLLEEKQKKKELKARAVDERKAIEAQQREEQKRIEEMMRLKNEEERRLQIEHKTQEKNRVKKWRQRVRLISNTIHALNATFCPIDFQLMSLAYQVDSLIKLCEDLFLRLEIPEDSKQFVGETVHPSEFPNLSDIINGKPPTLIHATASFIQEAIDEYKRKQTGDQGKKEPSAAVDKVRKNKNEETEWSVDELRALAKALQKYPGGTHQRWQLVADSIGSKTCEEVIIKAKSVGDSTSLKSLGSKLSEKAYEQFLDQNKGAFQEIKVEPDKRDFGALENWSREQQQSLEAALGKYPSSLPASERWTCIANEVTGKTKQECVKRFQYIRSLVNKQNVRPSKEVS